MQKRQNHYRTGEGGMQVKIDWSRLDDPEYYEDGEVRPSSNQLARVAELLLDLSQNTPKPIVGTFWGELTVEWRNQEGPPLKIVRLISFPDGRLALYKFNSAQFESGNPTPMVMNPTADQVQSALFVELGIIA